MARSYSDETKAQVMAALLAGQTVREAAEEYEIPRGTVGNWSAKLREAGVPVVPDAKKEEFGALILEKLRCLFVAQAAMTKVFSDREWLKQQDASELAVLYGVLDDKQHRMIQMLATQDASDDNAT